MLTALQAYIADHGTVAIGDLSLHFRSDRTCLQPMLAKLVQKGRIRKIPAPSKCGDCTSCDLSHLEAYEWLGR